MRWDIATFALTATMLLLQLIDFILDKLDRYRSNHPPRRKPRHKK